jgi:hypothetical protein
VSKKHEHDPLPGPVSLAAIQAGVLQDDREHELNRIREYVEWQSNKGRPRNRKKIKVVHLELMKSESVFGRRHDAWDVHTNEADGRWWVITEPTNLYSQHEFPSLDYTISFHVGVMARVASRDAKAGPTAQSERFRSAWRRLENAHESLDRATEAEDFQAVGMRCREALVDIAKSMQVTVPVAAGTEQPKAADFKGWLTLLAAHFAEGKRNEHVRSYLNNTGKEVWQLASWLTHTSNASIHDAQIVVEVTTTFVTLFGLVVIRHEAGAPRRCPACDSYRLASVYEPDLGIDPPYVNLCESCGWNSFDTGEQEAPL